MSLYTFVITQNEQKQLLNLLAGADHTVFDAPLTCNPLQQSAHIKDAFLHDALEAHGED